MTLVQDTDGEGMPDALQNRVTLPPSVITSFCIGWMDEGTASMVESEKQVEIMLLHLFTITYGQL